MASLGDKSPIRNRTRPVALGATLSSMTLATLYPVVVCLLTWEKWSDIAAPKAGTGKVTWIWVLWKSKRRMEKVWRTVFDE